MAAGKKKHGGDVLRRQVRAEQVLRDREAIEKLREHIAGYEASEGYDLRKIPAMPYSRRRALRAKYARVKRLLDQPYVQIVEPKTPGERRKLREFTGQRFRGQKDFIVHRPSKDSRVTFRDGQLHVTTKLPGEVVYEERFFMFKRRPKSQDEMIGALRRMMRQMPEDGSYEILTDTYGGVGDIVDKGQLEDKLTTYLTGYDNPKYGTARFLNRVIGVRWFQSLVRGIEVRQERSEARANIRALNRKRKLRLEREAKRRGR